MPRFRKATLEIANDYAQQLRRITVPRRLIREGPKPVAVRWEKWAGNVRVPVRNRCRERA